MPNFPVTKATWTQVAPKQAYEEMQNGNFNVDEFPIELDPIYHQLIRQISQTTAHKMRIRQNWRNLGTTSNESAYQGILREILMLQRKGHNYAMDVDVRPDTLLNYPIVEDTIVTRYHSSQFRMMYDYTLDNAELQRFAGQPSVIMDIAEQKAINGSNYQNMYVDQLRKKLFSMLVGTYGIEHIIDIDITDYETLTAEQARTWIVKVDMLLRELRTGTARFNVLGEYQQIDTSDLQLVIPADWWQAVVLRAFPNLRNENYFKELLPENLILIDTLGDDKLLDSDGVTELTPTFNTSVGYEGGNQLNWISGMDTAPRDENLMAVIMHKRAMSVGDQLNSTHVGTMDIRKLKTPVAMHFWNTAMMTDLLPVIAIRKAV